jgi:hypothetical protein
MTLPNSTPAHHELIDAVAAELTAGIDRAVGFWMNQIGDVLQDSRLTTLGRLQALKDLVGNYRDGCAVGVMNDHGNAA